MEPVRLDASSDDAALARAIAAAAPRVDRAAEAELCRRFAPRVRLYGLRHLRDPHAAADLVQQVLLLALEKLRAGALNEPDRLGGFVLGIARMVLLDQRRATRRREALLGLYGDRAPVVEPEEPAGLEAEKVARCLERLTERERAVIVQSFFAEQSADAVGKALGLTAGNTRVIRHRALLKLRDCLAARGAP